MTSAKVLPYSPSSPDNVVSNLPSGPVTQGKTSVPVNFVTQTTTVEGGNPTPNQGNNANTPTLAAGTSNPNTPAQAENNQPASPEPAQENQPTAPVPAPAPANQPIHAASMGAEFKTTLIIHRLF